MMRPTNSGGIMTSEIIENAIVKERKPEDIVHLKQAEAFICANNTISNCDNVCPCCLSQTEPLRTHNSTPLAHEIAEESAKSDIESFCVWRITDDGLLPTRWYDIATQLHDGERAWVDRAVRYLEARGILVRNQQNASLVRWEGL